jgi:hypothetical protein
MEKVRAHQAQCEEIANREKQLSANFKSNFPNLDVDAVSALQKLFRQKVPQGKYQ